jgi:hypothetical protein
MTTSDKYDGHVVFDDIYDMSILPPEMDLLGTAQDVLHRVHRHRTIKPIAHDVIGTSFDTTAWSFQPVGLCCIGADAEVQKGEFPIFDDLKKKFGNAYGDPKLARLDTDETYIEFRMTRRIPYEARVEDRLRQLEAAVALRGNEGSAAGDDSLAAFTGNSVIGAVADAAVGGKKVPLPLPAWAKGKVECWQDGNEVLVTVRLPGGLCATTATDADTHVEDVAGHAMVLGVEPLDVQVLGSSLGPVVGADKLLGELCRAVPALREQGAPFVGLMVPAGDAGLAAMMSLLQKCQRGDKRACREVARMGQTKAANLIAQAGKALEQAQRKNRRSR